MGPAFPSTTLKVCIMWNCSPKCSVFYVVAQCGLVNTANLDQPSPGRWLWMQLCLCKVCAGLCISLPPERERWGGKSNVIRPGPRSRSSKHPQEQGRNSDGWETSLRSSDSKGNGADGECAVHTSPHVRAAPEITNIVLHTGSLNSELQLCEEWKNMNVYLSFDSNISRQRQLSSVLQAYVVFIKN